MKAFVYKKDKKSDLFKVVNGVKEVQEKEEVIIIIPEDGFSLQFDKRKFKTTIYQN